jgi:hypothetical protein
MHREAFCWKEFSGNKQRGGGEARKLCEVPIVTPCVSVCVYLLILLLFLERNISCKRAYCIAS